MQSLPKPRLVTHPAVVKKLVVSAVAVSVLINLLALVQPIFMLVVYDNVLTSRSEPTLGYLAVMAVFLICLNGVFGHLRAKLMMDVAEEIDAQAKDRVLLGALAEGLRIGRNVHGRMSSDFESVRTFISGAPALALLDLPWTPIFLLALLIVSPPVAALVTVFSAAVFAAAVIADANVRPSLEKAGEHLGKAGRTASNIVTSADAVRAMGFARHARRRWADETMAAAALQRHAAERMNISSEMVKQLRLVLQVLILALAALLVLVGELTPGAMIACSMIGTRTLQPLDQVANSWRQVVLARIAWGKLAAAAAHFDRENRPRTTLPPPSGAITLTDVSVMTLGRSDPILRRVSLDIGAGEFVGVVGPSGSGKSTLLRVLAGATPPTAGGVFYDGAGLEHWPLDALGKHVGYFPQAPALLAGTIAENIGRFDTHDEAAITAAAVMAGAHEMILSFPAGYATEVADGGAALSGGQRARVALARACYGDPRLLFLDEPFAHLDTEGEQALWTMLSRLRAMRKTLVMTTHRPSHLRNFDKVAVVQDGRVVRTGPVQSVLNDLAPKRTLASV